MLQVVCNTPCMLIGILVLGVPGAAFTDTYDSCGLAIQKIRLVMIA